jgi:endoglucanase
MQFVLGWKEESPKIWTEYKANAENFICSCAQKSTKNVEKTPGGLLWFQPWANIQYVSTATFAMATYSKYLSKKQATLQCSEGDVSPSDLTSLVQAQVIQFECIN